MTDDNRRPLAFRMAPRTLSEYVGQEHIIGKGKMLRRMIEADRLSSIILFGPPGTGKTALARVVANSTSSRFETLNAVTAGVSDIKNVIADATNPILSEGRRTVLFIDEIHRFNKLQQDALLPFVEDGTVILIGATTENPFFEVNKALVSRSTVLQLHSLTEDDVVRILKNALSDEERGYGKTDVKISDDTLRKIAGLAGGDGRNALKALELAVITTAPSSDGSINITDEIISDCMQKRTVLFDKDGENHYDNISAMIKSMRGSDPNAAVLYLSRALEAGEDIEFLARRIMICASEDVGLANPNALLIAVAAYQCAAAVGMPEARIPLAEAAIAVASSPKSNASYLAVDKALADVRSKDTGSVPMHLRNAPAKGMEDLGYSVGYKYPHDFPHHITYQQYMPDKVKDVVYYEPTDIGYEKKITEYLDFVKKLTEGEDK
ncbi:MAG: replication-associated recombination protein A [Clostridiales bacterium]|nr:replication-associated recombination protein A [Clostridiales bacterium]MBR6484766.1 replication-associated recombination protein A [Clostridiales bacterium]